jgi:hypothetical protein
MFFKRKRVGERVKSEMRAVMQVRVARLERFSMHVFWDRMKAWNNREWGDLR